MTRQTHRLPIFLFEDCLGLLRGLVVLAWLGVAAGIVTELYIRFYSVYEWPLFGGFSTTYNAVLLEFTLNTVVLTLLLVQRDWYERVPREAAHRLNWLLIAVLIWEGLHLFGAYHVTGSLRGPLLPLLPVLLMAIVIALPVRLAGWMAAYLVTGYVAVPLLELSGRINPRGLLADAFALTLPMPALGLVSLLSVLVMALVLGFLIRRWQHPDAMQLSVARRVDHETGLFRRPFLMQRIQAELARTRRQGGEVGLLLLCLDGQQAVMSSVRELVDLAHRLLAIVRLESDTPARYGPGVLAVLLPAAGGREGIAHFVRRLMGEVTPELASRMRVAAVITKGMNITAESLMRDAEENLQHAQVGGKLDVVTLGADR